MARLRRSEVERRQHRRRLLLAGAADGVGYPQLPQVQILLSNGTWLDISTDVRYQARITVRRGKSARDKRTRTATATFQLDNNLGKYSRNNPNSLLYGLISRNTQVIISNMGTVRFWGEIPEWPPTWTTGSKDGTVTISAAGWLRRLTAPQQRVLASTLRRTIGNSQAVAWWPLDDGTSSTTGASGLSSGAPMTQINGGVHFGTTSDLGGSAIEPTFDIQDPTLMTYGGLAGTVPALGDNWGCEFAAKVDPSVSNAMINITLSNGNIISVFPQSSPLVCQVYMYNNANIVSVSGSLADAAVVANFNSKTWHYYAFYVRQHGAGVGCEFYIDGVLSGSLGGTFAATLAAPTTFQVNVQQLGSATVGGGDGTLKSFSSLAFFNGRFPSAGGAAYTGYTGEAAGVRVQRLCTENGVPFVAYGDLTNSEAMGPQAVDTFIGLLYDCEDADGGQLFETREQFALSYITRASLYNQPASVALDHSMSGNLDSAPKIRDDDQGITNKTTAKRRNGSSAVFEKTTGVNNSANPPVGIGLYDEAPEFNVATDAQLLDIAGWRVAVGTVDDMRIEMVSVNVANMVVNHGLVSLAGSVLTARVGSRMTLDNCPTQWVPPGQQSQILVGQYEQFDQFTYTIDFDTIQESIYHVSVLEDPILGRCESDGTSTVNSHIATDTVFSVQTATGELWITNALFPADFPFDIRCNGERATVTNITGASSPQVWTFIRAVNGVAAFWPANSPIVLAQPMIMAR